MESELTFRPPQDDDLESIAALESAAFPSPWKKEFFAAEIQSVGRFNLVIVDPHGSLVGYLFTMYYLDELHVNKIAIDERWRRFGLARQLMQRCVDFAAKNDIRSISLEVRESNSPARALYRSLGFDEAYVRPRYYPEGEDAVVMVWLEAGN